MEERLRRHERILRHRYSKMLRRRALWERDQTSRLSWPWKLSHRWLAGGLSNAQNLSSSHSSQAKPEEQRDEDKWKDSRLATFHKDFESFKNAVDRAIERDPYGTLFGRRLQSPPTANNSSWTSFSWIFDPKEIKEASSEPQKSASPPPDKGPTPDPIPRTDDQSLTASRIPTSQSVAIDEYEYDPISMRKVPKARSETQKPSAEEPRPPTKPTSSSKAESKPKTESIEPPRRTFFETLFGEHGVDIPVKTYKPPKVYGYGAEQPKRKAEAVSTKKDLSFETSRKQELKALKAKTLGNTIDTTAEYFGKYSPEGEDAPSENPAKPRAQPEPSDDTPLFTGTAYEGRLSEISQRQVPKSDWLRKEGFSAGETAPKGMDDAVNIPVKKFKPKIEFSLDRMQRQSAKPGKVPPVKLESALDRQQRSPGTKVPSVEPPTLKHSTVEKLEDLDFLRASDVRAAARSARISKQQKAEQKVEIRKKLEDDFSSRQSQAETNQPLASDWGKSRIAKSLENVRKHVLEYPDGIVARTVNSMGIFNENWKKYVRPEPKVDLNKPLTFKDESLSQVASIHKPRRKTSASISFMPSKEVLEAERLSQQRSRDLQKANASAKEKTEEETAKANELARSLRREYENEYGKINVRHRQVTSTEQSQEADVKQHPLSTATVKEGIARYPVIESHVSKFEPKLSELVQEAKHVRRELHEAQIHYRQLKDNINKRPWTEIEITGAKASAPALCVSDEPSAQGLDEPITALGSSSGETAAPPTIQEPIFTPDGSPIWNDEHPPPIPELKEAFTSPFVILKYNGETSSVSRLTAHFHEAGQQKLPSPLKILSRLQHPEKFYPYFAALEQANYEIISSNFDTLIFRKAGYSKALKQEEEEAKNRAAAEEAAAQVVTEQVFDERPEVQRKPRSKEAATVLDEIPLDIEPAPGPAAPTAPPSTPTSKPATAPVVTPKPKVKRQEDVFSGTRTSRPTTQITNPIDPEMAAPRPSPPFEDTADPATQSSFFSRFFRTVKRVIYTTLAVGVGAYVVGVITEGLDAKTQQMAIANGNAGDVGPRKKVVMPVQPEWTGKRAGIFSTENSR